MEIVFLYIHDYKKLHDIAVPLHGNFNVTYNPQKLSVSQVPHPDDYYQHIPMTLILGKNGVGKTSILDCLQEMCTYERCSAWVIFHHQGELYIFFCNHPHLEINCKIPYRIIYDLPGYIKESQTTLVTLNNAIDFNSLFFSNRRYSTRGGFQDAGLSRYSRGNRQHRNEIISRFSIFVSSSSWLKKKMPDVEHGFHVKLLQPSDFRLRAIARNALNENPKWTSVLIERFNDAYHDYITNANYCTFPFCDRQATEECIQRINSGRYDPLSEIISLLTKVNDQTDSPEQQLWRFIPAYAYGLLSELVRDKHYIIDLYPELLISLYFLRENDVLDHIQSWLKKAGTDNQGIFPIRIPDARWQWKETRETLLELINLVKHISSSNNDSVAVFYDAPDIIKFTTTIQRVPEYLRDRIDFGWSRISSGEFAQAFLFSQIYHYLHQPSNDALIFLIDEVDLYLHPEWQRLFISELISFIKDSVKNRPVQFIFTTHSPIIASDFLPHDIVCLDKPTDGQTLVVKNPEFGFGSPLPEYYTGGFFVEYTIGDHALRWLRQLMDKNSPMSETGRIIIEQITNEFLLRLIKGDTSDKKNKKTWIDKA